MKGIIEKMSNERDVVDMSNITTEKNWVSKIQLFPIPYYSHRAVVKFITSDGTETILDFHHEDLNDFIAKYIKENDYNVKDFS